MLYSKLRDYQKETVDKAIRNKKQLIAFDTGLGKTFTTISICEELKKKTIWYGPLSVLEQTNKDIKEETDLQSLIIREKGFNLTSVDQVKDIDILLVAFEAMDNREVSDYVSQVIKTDLFKIIVIDEVQLVSNIDSSNRNSMIMYSAYNSEYKYLLSATPLISQTKQFANILTVLETNRDLFFKFNLDVENGLYSLHTKHELITYKVRESSSPIYIHQFNLDKIKEPETSNVSLFKHTRNRQSLNELNNIISANLGKKFIIYSYITDNHKPIKEYLEDMGYSVLIVSGKTNNTNIEEKFKEYDCAIYSISQGINLPADFCIMYDWNIYAHQAIGRGCRKEDAENYEVYFMVSDNEKERDSWLNTLLPNIKMFYRSIGKSPLQEFIE